MTYFDDKEEVINLELTPYGKMLLSKGNFKPYYYSFFDDSIIYDSNYMSIEETQNYTQTRILNDTPSTKAQSVVSTVDVNPKILDGVKNVDKNNINFLPLGNSSNNSEYAPAWNIVFISGTLLTSEKYDNDNLPIPQLNLQKVNFFIQIVKDGLEIPKDYFYLTSYETEKGFYDYYVLENDLLLDVSELNTDNLLENFDVEVYLEESDFKADASLPQTKWKQLHFAKPIVYVKDNLLLDKPENTNDIDSLDTNTDYVEHYFNILIDNEIELPPEYKTTIKIYDSVPLNGPFGENC
jgi:hypothetical protein